MVESISTSVYDGERKICARSPSENLEYCGIYIIITCAIIFNDIQFSKVYFLTQWDIIKFHRRWQCLLQYYSGRLFYIFPPTRDTRIELSFQFQSFQGILVLLIYLDKFIILVADKSWYIVAVKNEYRRLQINIGQVSPFFCVNIDTGNR